LPRLARVTSVPNEEVPVARIEGEVDISNADDLRQSLLQLVDNAALGLVVDLSGVRYIDSAGVHLILRLAAELQQRRQRVRAVVPADEAVRHVLDLMAVERMAPMHESEDEAVAAVRASGD
jgi:anti-sigma B factor antagonist